MRGNICFLSIFFHAILLLWLWPVILCVLFCFLIACIIFIMQVTPQDPLSVLLDNGGRSSTISVLFPLDDSFIAPSTEDERESNV